MSRLSGISDHDASLGARIAFFVTKRKLAKLAGLQTAAMLEPLRIYAHIPTLLSAYGGLERAESKLDMLSPRVRVLAELTAATTVGCAYCIDLGSQIARRLGLGDQELLALADFERAACFSDVDKLVLRYATAISRTPVEVSDELFEALRAQFDTAQLVALTHVVTLGNLRARFNIALGIEASGFSGFSGSSGFSGFSGFSGNRVCALPHPTAR